MGDKSKFVVILIGGKPVLAVKCNVRAGPPIIIKRDE